MAEFTHVMVAASRMCDSMKCCDECPLYINGCCLMYVPDSDNLTPMQAEHIILEWENAHPIKTMRDVLLEKFPNAKCNESGTPSVCPNQVEKRWEPMCDIGLPAGHPKRFSFAFVRPTLVRCAECWNRPVENQ